MARIWGLIYLSLLTCLGGSEAFSYHETINITRKSSDEKYQYSIGPEFFDNDTFAYARVKQFDSTSLKIDLEVFDKKSSISKISSKKFVADVGSLYLSVTSVKAGHITIIGITEQLKNGESKTMLVRWDPYSYPDPSLYLPSSHKIVNRGWYFDVIVNDKAICHTINGKCRFQFEDKNNSKKLGFVSDNLTWPSLQIAHASHSNRLFIRGFDSVGNFKFLDCGFKNCSQLLFLPKASKTLEVHSLDCGLCLIEKPGKDNSVKCLKFENELAKLNRTVTYEKPMSLLHVKDLDKTRIVLVAKKIDCTGTDCSDIVLSNIPLDSSMPITHRELKFECSEKGKLFNVSVTKNQYQHSLTIEYICENNEAFTFKSVTINDD